ncbi:MAG: hypothetical protein D6730_13190 [Bacteroidetes bacterium]|nr:MAG: hypothetical protein D6730_13190 [Bacteroidota bacterium]
MKKLLFWALGILLCAAAQPLHAQRKPLSGKTLFGGLMARQIGPATMSGRISDIEAVEKDPTIIYVGSAGGGLWKSNSAGAAFRPIFDDYCMSIGKIAIDQQHPDTLWVGTGEPWVRNSVSVGTGIYKSTNGGSNWQLMGLENSERISDVLIDPQNPNTVYVAVQGHLWKANPERGVYKTTDGGQSWQQVLFIDEHTGCADMAMDPNNPQVLYAAMWSHRRYPDFFDSGLKHLNGYASQSGLYKSTDGGQNWQQLTNGLPEEPMGRLAVETGRQNGDIVYLTVEVENKDKKGLYSSQDAGASWKKVNGEFGMTVRPFYFSRLTVDPTDDSTLFKCGLNLSISEDGGERFRQVGSAVHSDIHAVWVDPNNPKHLLIGTDGGVYESLDGGYLFKMFMNLPVSQFYHVTVDMEQPYHVYGGLQDNGSWFGPSQKAGGITNSDWKNTFGGDGFHSFRHPTDPDIVYAEYQGGQLVRYNTATGQAKDIKPYPRKDEPKFRFNWNAPIHQSPNNPERMYFGAQFLFMSEDRGDSWQRLSPDLTTNDPQRQRQARSGGLSIDNSTAENNTTIYAIAESPVNEQVIWVGTDDGYLQVTSDQGKSWTNVTANIPGLPQGNWVTDVEPGHFDQQTAYVTYDNHRNGDKTPYLFKTTDMGKSWQSLVTPEIEGYALSIAEDLQNPNLLFLGTEFGLYVSLDGGQSWSRFENNVPKVGVREMVIHPREDALVMATHGRGIIILDDISPMRQLSDEIMAKDIHFFQTKPTVLRDPGAGGNWFGGAGNFVGPNPSTNAQIVYFMKRRHTFGKMYLEVYDTEGKLLRELPAGKSAGINVVDMPTALRKPKAAPTNNRMALFGSIIGPNLPAGTYKVKLIKGKKEYETSFTLQYDPLSPYTPEERDIQRKTTMRLYKLTEDMAYIYASLQAAEKAAREYAETSARLAKKLTPYAEELARFSSTLVALEGDFYVDESEQIRERISDLYRQVSTYPGRPSDSQIERTDVLEAEMQQIQTRFEELTGPSMEKINKLLVRAKLEPISLQSREAFLSDEGGTSSGSSGGSYRQLQHWAPAFTGFSEFWLNF